MMERNSCTVISVNHPGPEQSSIVLIGLAIKLELHLLAVYCG